MRINNKSLFPYRGKYGSRPPLNFGRTKTHIQSPIGTSILLTDAYDGLIGPVWIAIPDPTFSDPDTMPVPPYLIATGPYTPAKSSRKRPTPRSRSWPTRARTCPQRQQCKPAST